jgi:hypothetical protein
MIRRTPARGGDLDPGLVADTASPGRVSPKVAHGLKERSSGGLERDMSRDIELSNLEAFLKEFSERHERRRVTLKLIRGTTPMTEAEGLPLVGIDLERRSSGVVDVEIMMGDEGLDGKRHLTHTVSDVRRVRVETEKGDREKRLILEGGSGEQAILGLG